MTLIKDRLEISDPFTKISADDAIPDSGALLVSLSVWQDHWEQLIRRQEPVGVQLASDEHPDVIADDVDQLALIALEFPTFRDGRAYSYARLIRERYGFTGELRAVGDVLPDQLHYMERVGFNAFELAGNRGVEDYLRADKDFSVWYQSSTDDRASALRLRTQVKNGG
ncbi:MAG: DUF934 domain-containing protein [Gammaproteobacteria bacterium]|nr:DUF934 domain-containing protein [Gammaproteobacteria bacterium]